VSALLAAAPEVVETTSVEFLNLPPDWVLALVVAPALVLFARWLYSRRTVEGRAWLPAALRAALLALLVAFLLRPVRLTQKVAVERPVAAVLLDDSASLREHDLPDLARRVGLPADATRSEVLRAVLAGPLADLAERYELHLFACGESLRALGGLSDLAAADGSTRLGDALAALAAETRGRDLSAVVLASDGRSNAGRDPLAALAALSGRRVPLHVLGVGDPAVPHDVRLAGVTVPEVALAGDTVTLEAAVAARGFPGAPATLLAVDESTGAELAREDFRLADDEGATEQVVRLGFVPPGEGDLAVRVSVVPQPGERDAANNVERRLLRVEPGRIKVLYVDGYARWEYSFLRSSLLRFANVEAQCLLLDAAPDFLQESSAGVPALKRFPDADTGNPLLDYHVIVFGDVHPQDLGARWELHLQRIKEFVEAGGGFLMQAGARAAPREYAGTPIADILPVVLGDPERELANVRDEDEPFRPVLERWRDPHEVVTLENDPLRNRELWQGEDGLAPLTWYWPVAKARGTAEVLLTHPTSGNADGPHVLLATMYQPQGRTAFLATDETWRWRFRFLETWREPFWKNLVRYLALNKLRRSDYRFDLATDLAAYDLGDSVQVSARVKDKEFQPLAAESFPVHLLRPDGVAEVLAAQPDEPGAFSASFVASEAGSYRLWLEDPDAPDAGPRSPRIVTASLPSLENDDPLLDEALLRNLAAQGGGRYARLADARGLLDSLRDPARERAVDEPEREELWAGWPPLLLLLGLASAEWVVRKRANLA
jgi:hypothetical protein